MDNEERLRRMRAIAWTLGARFYERYPLVPEERAVIPSGAPGKDEGFENA